MTSIDYTDELRRIKNRFTTPYYTEDGGNIDKLMHVVATPLAELRDTSADVVASHQLSEATGSSLDRLGSLLQLARNAGETDSLYRARLMTQSLIRRRSATSPDMVTTCANVLGVGTDRVTFVEGAVPASFGLQVLLADITAAGIDLTEFRSMMDDAKAGGVTMAITTIGSFACRGIGDADDNTMAYTDIHNTNPDGGIYSGVI